MVTQVLETRINGTKETLLGELTGSFSDKSFVGHAKIVVRYDDIRWGRWNQPNADVVIKAGFEGSYFRNIFNGTISNPMKEEKVICVELTDYGQNFQRPYCGTYQNQPLGDVITQMCSEVDYTANLSGVSPKTLERIISRSNTIESGLLEPLDPKAVVCETAGTLCGLFKCSNPANKNCVSYSDQFYLTCVDNKCSYCGKSDCLIIDASSDANAYFCTHCGAIYCGIDGYQTNMDKRSKINITFGPSNNTNYAKMPKYSPTNSFSYEKELRTIADNNNLYIYLTQNKQLVVKEFHGTPTPDITIPQHAIEYKTYQFLDTANKKINSVVVNCVD